MLTIAERLDKVKIWLKKYDKFLLPVSGSSQSDDEDGSKLENCSKCSVCSFDGDQDDENIELISVSQQLYNNEINAGQCKVDKVEIQDYDNGKSKKDSGTEESAEENRVEHRKKKETTENCKTYNRKKVYRNRNRPSRKLLKHRPLPDLFNNNIENLKISKQLPKNLFTTKDNFEVVDNNDISDKSIASAFNQICEDDNDFLFQTLPKYTMPREEYATSEENSSDTDWAEDKKIDLDEVFDRKKFKRHRLEELFARNTVRGQKKLSTVNRPRPKKVLVHAMDSERYLIKAENMSEALKIYNMYKSDNDTPSLNFKEKGEIQENGENLEIIFSDVGNKDIDITDVRADENDNIGLRIKESKNINEKSNKLLVEEEVAGENILRQIEEVLSPRITETIDEHMAENKNSGDEKLVESHEDIIIQEEHVIIEPVEKITKHTEECLNPAITNTLQHQTTENKNTGDEKLAGNQEEIVIQEEHVIIETVDSEKITKHSKETLNPAISNTVKRQTTENKNSGDEKLEENQEEIIIREEHVTNETVDSEKKTNHSEENNRPLCPAIITDTTADQTTNTGDEKLEKLRAVVLLEKLVVAESVGSDKISNENLHCTEKIVSKNNEMQSANNSKDNNKTSTTDNIFVQPELIHKPIMSTAHTINKPMGDYTTTNATVSIKPKYKSLKIIIRNFGSEWFFNNRRHFSKVASTIKMALFKKRRRRGKFKKAGKLRITARSLRIDWTLLDDRLREMNVAVWNRLKITGGNIVDQKKRQTCKKLANVNDTIHATDKLSKVCVRVESVGEGIEHVKDILENLSTLPQLENLVIRKEPDPSALNARNSAEIVENTPVKKSKISTGKVSKIVRDAESVLRVSKRSSRKPKADPSRVIGCKKFTHPKRIRKPILENLNTTSKIVIQCSRCTRQKPENDVISSSGTKDDKCAESNSKRKRETRKENTSNAIEGKTYNTKKFKGNFNPGSKIKSHRSKEKPFGGKCFKDSRKTLPNTYNHRTVIFSGNTSCLEKDDDLKRMKNQGAADTTALGRIITNGHKITTCDSVTDQAVIFETANYKQIDCTGKPIQNETNTVNRIISSTMNVGYNESTEKLTKGDNVAVNPTITHAKNIEYDTCDSKNPTSKNIYLKNTSKKEEADVFSKYFAKEKTSKKEVENVKEIAAYTNTKLNEVRFDEINSTEEGTANIIDDLKIMNNKTRTALEGGWQTDRAKESMQTMIRKHRLILQDNLPKMFEPIINNGEFFDTEKIVESGSVVEGKIQSEKYCIKYGDRCNVYPTIETAVSNSRRNGEVYFDGGFEISPADIDAGTRTSPSLEKSKLTGLNPNGVNGELTIGSQKDPGSEQSVLFSLNTAISHKTTLGILVHETEKYDEEIEVNRQCPGNLVSTCNYYTSAEVENTDNADYIESPFKTDDLEYHTRNITAVVHHKGDNESVRLDHFSQNTLNSFPVDYVSSSMKSDYHYRGSKITNTSAYFIQKPAYSRDQRTNEDIVYEQDLYWKENYNNSSVSHDQNMFLPENFQRNIRVTEEPRKPEELDNSLEGLEYNNRYRQRNNLDDREAADIEFVISNFNSEEWDVLIPEVTSETDDPREISQRTETVYNEKNAFKYVRDKLDDTPRKIYKNGNEQDVAQTIFPLSTNYQHNFDTITCGKVVENYTNNNKIMQVVLDTEKSVLEKIQKCNTNKNQGYFTKQKNSTVNNTNLSVDKNTEQNENLKRIEIDYVENNLKEQMMRLSNRQKNISEPSETACDSTNENYIINSRNTYTERNEIFDNDEMGFVENLSKEERVTRPRSDITSTHKEPSKVYVFSSNTNEKQGCNEHVDNGTRENVCKCKIAEHGDMRKRLCNKKEIDYNRKEEIIKDSKVQIGRNYENPCLKERSTPSVFCGRKSVLLCDEHQSDISCPNPSTSLGTSESIIQNSF